MNAGDSGCADWMSVISTMPVGTNSLLSGDDYVDRIEVPSSRLLMRYTKCAAGRR
jgi:hypothetical protein